MFLAGDNTALRERKVRSFLAEEPSVALMVAAVNFEWTVSRAVMFLSTTKNTKLHNEMIKFHGPDNYKKLWKQEVVPQGHLTLVQVIPNWDDVLKAFDERNRIVHGKKRHTRNMATPHVEALLAAVSAIATYCDARGKPLTRRMPVRPVRRVR